MIILSPPGNNACMNTNTNVPNWDRNAVEEYIDGQQITGSNRQLFRLRNNLV